MEIIKPDGIAPLTLHAIPGELLSPITPVKKMPPKRKPTQPQIVYKEEMERMSNRDWTGVKKRLRYALKYFEKEYLKYENFVPYPAVLRDYLSAKQIRKIKNKHKEMVDALNTILNYEGLIGNSRITKEDFKPKDFYRLHIGQNRFFDGSGNPLYDKHGNPID
jgi:hypothetical protein